MPYTISSRPLIDPAPPSGAMVTPKPPLSYTRQLDGYPMSYAPFERRRNELEGAGTRPTDPLLLVIGGLPPLLLALDCAISPRVRALPCARSSCLICASWVVFCVGVSATRSSCASLRMRA